MVGTGRIELPTSSVSRKRSPTELRAFKIREDRSSPIPLSHVEYKIMAGKHAVLQEPLSQFHSVVQETDFTTNFSSYCQPSPVIFGAWFCSHTSPR